MNSSYLLSACLLSLLWLALGLEWDGGKVGLTCEVSVPRQGYWIGF